MVIQIERISAQNIRRSASHCVEPLCATPATWFLVDRSMPESHPANMGERVCCVEHLTSTYMSLRGAHLVAQAPPATRVSDIRLGGDRRGRRRRRTIANVAGDVLVAVSG
jgi:hypothetical protein